MSDDIRAAAPNSLRLPPSRASGADPWKLHQQLKKFGASKDGMPPIFVYEDPALFSECAGRGQSDALSSVL